MPYNRRCQFKNKNAFKSSNLNNSLYAHNLGATDLVAVDLIVVVTLSYQSFAGASGTTTESTGADVNAV